MDSLKASVLARLKSLWRDLAGGGGRERLVVSPDLSADDFLRLEQQMRACLEARGGEVSARQRAAELGRAYLSLSRQGRRRFLSLLAEGFAADRQAVDAAVADLAAALDGAARDKAERALRQALEPPRLRLLTQFNALPEGVKFLVDLRAELLDALADAPALAGLEADLKGLLAGWFDVGFLELQRITWRSPALVLERIMAYEAVHAIQGWDDLKNRLDSDRRLYAFFHPRMPDEPLIFVEVALVQGMAGNVQDLLDPAAPVGDSNGADTAIFYSINNAQRGLAGISFGNFLIKTVVDDLSRQFPGLRVFSTLSPIPGFRPWLERMLAQGEPGLLTAAEHAQLAAACGGRGGKGSLKTLLSQEGWHRDEARRDALKPALMRLCARYLTREKGRSGRALDPVAHFHLSNGARVERLNWLGDTSAKGMAQSCGIMVNYLYKLDEIEENHEAYSATGKAATGADIRRL